MNDIYPAAEDAAGEQKTPLSFEIYQGITSLWSVLPRRSRGSLAVRRVAVLAGSYFFITLLRQRFMTDDKQNTPFPPEDRRTEYVSDKVTPGQKQLVLWLADECGMTVSNYILTRVFGYRPKAKLTAWKETVMETLIGCRSNLVNYMSALRGMNPERRRQMFGSYPFILEWLKDFGQLVDRVTGVLDRVRLNNRVPDGTRNNEDREEES